MTDSHGKVYVPDGAVAGEVNYPASGVITLTFSNIVLDPLLFVDLQIKNGTDDIVQANLSAALKHTTTGNISTPLNFQTTVAARALKRLLQNEGPGNPAQPVRARDVDLAQLNTLTAAITGVSGTAPALSYSQNHPSLVNVSLLADHLQTQNPEDLTAVNYRQNGATVSIDVSGLNGGDKLQLQITDAASAILTNLSNGPVNVTGVTPGTGLRVKATPFGTPAQHYNYTIAPTTFTLSEGITTPVVVTAVPFAITGISPAQGAIGSTVTIAGSAFTGATDVNFNGVPAASFTVDSDTQIRAVVPVGATDGSITVVNNSSVNSSNFDVRRHLHVNDTASGSNNGSSWNDAYTDLQTALAAAESNDEIWIAAGIYTPHASDRNVSFQLKSNVNIYGGFEGTETMLTARTASLTDFVTILSGDLSGNDNYTTPGTTLDENTKTIVLGANASTLEGVTVQGAKGATNGGGMLNTSSSPTLSNVTFSNNSASNGGGVSNRSSSNPTLTNVTFSNNSASSSGGGMRNESSSPTLSNVTFFNNSADFGGGMANRSSSNPTLTNVTFSNNSANDGGGVDNSSSSPILKNVLFWNSTLFQQTIDNAQGNFAFTGTAGAVNDPFFDSANPNGPDGIPRTADDGLRINDSAREVLNIGVTGGSTSTDILGNPRLGKPEPGAYENQNIAWPGNVLVVKADATGNNDGTSWANAFNSLQSALAAAGTNGKNEIWIAAGTYTPHANDRDVVFAMKAGVSIYGGFAGTENATGDRTSDPCRLRYGAQWRFNRQR